jgi:hypothetical protein
MNLTVPSDCEYPLFVPPLNLALKLPRDWTEAEARHYFMWLTAGMDDRIAVSLRILGEESTTDSSALLKSVGRKAMWVLRKREFTFDQVDKAPRLTDCGYALAADLGLLVASSLIGANERIHWTILRRPKSEFSHNQPVLSGFGRQFLNPISGSITETLKSLRSGDGEGGWFRIFDHWLRLANVST